MLKTQSRHGTVHRKWKEDAIKFKYKECREAEEKEEVERKKITTNRIRIIIICTQHRSWLAQNVSIHTETDTHT